MQPVLGMDTLRIAVKVTHNPETLSISGSAAWWTFALWLSVLAVSRMKLEHSYVQYL